MRAGTLICVSIRYRLYYVQVIILGNRSNGLNFGRLGNKSDWKVHLIPWKGREETMREQEVQQRYIEELNRYQKQVEKLQEMQKKKAA